MYATIPSGQRSKGGATVAIKKEISHKRLNIRTTLQVVALEVYMTEKRKKDNILNISTPHRPTDRETYEKSPGATPSTYDIAGRYQCTQPTVRK